MLRDKSTLSNWGVGIGFVLQIVAFVIDSPKLLDPDNRNAGVAWILAVVATIWYLYGCMNYAVAKGQRPWLGLLGLLSFIGLVILICLPDKYPDGRKTAQPGVSPDDAPNRR